jgi:hypothetical protein
VDQALAENSPVALSKVGLTPADAFTTRLGGDASLTDAAGLSLGVRIKNQMKPEVQPQIFLIGNQLQATAVDRDGISQLISYIDKQINQGTLSNIWVKIDATFTAPRFLMHRSNDCFVSAATAESAKRLLNVLQTQWTDVKKGLQSNEVAHTEHHRPSILMKMTFQPNDEFRGVAKIAFETTALLRGSQFVLRPSFDPIREYIKGDLRLPDIDPADSESLAIDQRFVQRMGKDFSLKFTDQHGVLLMAFPFGIFALVVLYGMHYYKVGLATVQDGDTWMRCYEFSYAKDTHGELNSLEFARRALERFPDQLSINKENIPRLLELLKEK